LAKKLDLAGENDNEEALISMYAHQLGDLFNRMGDVVNENDEKRREALTSVLFNQTWPSNLRYFETRLIRNGRNGYLVGNKYSWADLYLSELIETIPSSRIKLLDNYPQVKRLDFNIRSLPQIKKWIASRPVTEI
jgi:glutathione S-transferase